MNVIVIALLSNAPILLNSEWPAHSCDPINAANYARIKKGMTHKEVEKTLGNTDDETWGGKIWHGRGRNAIIVGFRPDGRANGKRYFNPPPLAANQEVVGRL